MGQETENSPSLPEVIHPGQGWGTWQGNVGKLARLLPMLVSGLAEIFKSSLVILLLSFVTLFCRLIEDLYLFSFFVGITVAPRGPQFKSEVVVLGAVQMHTKRQPLH